MKFFRSHSITMGLVPLLFLSLIIYMLSLRSSSLQAQSSPTVFSLPFTISNQGIAYDSKSNLIVVSDYKSNTVQLINLTTGASSNVTVGARPVAAAIYATSTKSYAYIGNEGSDTISVIDLSTKSVIKTIAVGQSPVSIAINASTDKGYVANFKSDNVTILNLATNTIAATATVGSEPTSVAINTATKKVYVANSKTNAISVIDGTSNAVTATISTVQSPEFIVVNSGTSTAYAFNSKGNSVFAINLSTNAVTATIPVGSEPVSMAIDAATNIGYVANLYNDSVSVINLSTNAVAGTYAVGRDPIGLAYYAPYLIVATERGDGLWVINSTTQPFGTSVPVSKNPVGVSVDPTTNRAVTANEKGNDVSIVDLSSLHVLATIPVGGHPMAVAVNSDTQTALAANEKDDTLSVIDLATNSVLGTIAVGKSPVGVAINPHINIAATANSKSDNISVIDLSTQSINGTIAVGKSPSAIAIQPAGNIGVVSNEKDNTVSIVDLSSRSVIATIPVGKDPAGVAIDPELDLAVVSNNKDNTASIIDLGGKKVVAVLNVGKDPRGVAINPSTHRAVVANFIDDTVTVIDLPNRIVVQTLAAGKSPVAIDINPNTNQAAVTLDSLNLLTVLQLDNPGPVISGIVPVAISAGNPDFTLTVQGSRFITTSVVKFNGQTMATRFESAAKLTASIPASAITNPGTIPVTVSNPTPGGGTSNSVSFTVINPTPYPAITSFSPTEGATGNLVTINGSNFNHTPVTIFFNGVQSVISSLKDNQITALVPPGAGSGQLSVRTAFGIANSTTPFNVRSRQDFALHANPQNSVIPANGSASFTVSLTDTGSVPFTGLVKLSLQNISAGLTGIFSSPYVSRNEAAILTLRSQQGDQATVTIAGTSNIAGSELTKTATITLGQSPVGATTLRGRILASKDGRPIVGATVKLGALITATDEGGNFVISNPPTGDQVFIIDGDTANQAGIIYPAALPVAVTIAAGADNPLPAPIYLHEVKTGYFTEINPLIDTIVTDPEIPYYEMRIPAGTVITGLDGQPNTKISVKPVPVDRLPIPSPPEGVHASEIYMYYFFKPGGGTPSQPIPVKMPNTFQATPGTRVMLWYYDESFTPDPNSNQWKSFGMGTVSNDARNVIPDPGVGIPKFCCGASFVANASSPGNPASPPDGCPSGVADPIDPFTGFFTYNKTDMSYPVPSKLRIDRLYNSGNGMVGSFGRGSSINYNHFLQGSGGALTYIPPEGGSYVLSQNADGSYTNINYPFLRGTKAYLNADGTRTLVFKDGDTYTFDTAGRLILIRDRNNNSMSITRDVNGFITDLSDSFGRRIFVSNTSVRIGSAIYTLISAVKDMAGRVVQYNYDGSARLTNVVFPDGSTTTYSYEGAGRIAAITNPRGIIEVTNQYDGSGRVILQTHSDGGVFNIAYNVVGGSVTQTAVTAPKGGTTTYRLSGAGYSSEITAAFGQKIIYDRAFSSNALNSVTDPLGRTTSYTYDANGNTTSVTDPAGNVTSYDYDPVVNNPTKITDALGNVTTFAYDGNGNIIQILTPKSELTTIAYNTSGQPVSITDAVGSISTFEYDEFGNMIKATDPLGNSAQREYDFIGRLIVATDPKGKITLYSYDDLNRMQVITDALNGETVFSYDENWNLLSVTDAKSQVISYTYNVRDKVATMTDPLGKTESYGYDQNDNLSTVTDRKAQTTTYQYDLENRAENILYADGRTTNYTYDAIGRLTYIEDSESGPIEYIYGNTGCAACGGAIDKVIQEITPLGSVSYTYDVVGRKATMTVAGQPTVNYAYDSDSRLTDIGTVINGVVSGFSFAHDTIGRRTSLTMPNGVTTTYAYDTASRLLNMNHLNPLNTVFEALSYTYDTAGNRTGMIRPAANLPMPNPANNTSYNQANQMLSFKDKTITYDDNGNMTSTVNFCGTTNYTWDARNRLAGMNGFNADCSPLTASFNYDALGRRVGKTINSRTIQYLYDGSDIVQEIEGGIVSVNYIRTQNIDEPLTRIASDGTVRHYVRDAQGSVIALTDETGAVRTTYAYDPFGNVTVTGEVSDNPFQYTGRENDGTGLYYYRARYYNAELQRFVSEDPIGLRGGINKFAYVGNNPVNWIDPWGLYKYSPTAGDPVDDTTGKAMTCFEQCSGLDITITAGKEGGHSQGSKHETGQACDVGKNSNPDLTTDTAQKCFTQCFGQSSYGQEEGNHYHFQTTPGKGGATGFPDGVK